MKTSLVGFVLCLIIYPSLAMPKDHGHKSGGKHSPPVIVLPPLVPFPVPPPFPPPGPFPPPPLLPIRPLRQDATDWFIPPHVGGDADFKGHGPRVELRVTLYINPQTPNEVWAAIEMDALETKNDWTHASNWGQPHRVRVATFARALTQIVTPTHFGLNADGTLRTFSYVDATDKAIDSFANPLGCNLILNLHFVGDCVGREAGTRTGVKIEFCEILAR